MKRGGACFTLRYKNNTLAKLKSVNETMKTELNEAQARYMNAQQVIATIKNEKRIQLNSLTLPEVRIMAIIVEFTTGRYRKCKRLFRRRCGRI